MVLNPTNIAFESLLCLRPGLEPAPLDPEMSAPTGWGEKTVFPLPLQSQTLHRKAKMPCPVPSHAAVQGFEKLMLITHIYYDGA